MRISKGYYLLGLDPDTTTSYHWRTMSVYGDVLRYRQWII